MESSQLLGLPCDIVLPGPAGKTVNNQKTTSDDEEESLASEDVCPLINGGGDEDAAK